ncbi:hypothetical protein [Actinoplanes sp. L3-i22]|uniref:hypothetical protein n=1 Tax=Actinoplanes sp. L3-i22 TaxID=2836373 RepID=UPI001C75F807|nr:hypothetical protein [Actinoplanes sp. L3-i22]BCY10837.1 hypothetical protein L3i22_059250 [Actinoplanes sp. L3-i22]
MSDRAVVQKLINEAARATLAPLGLRQKGRSRLWFDDRGWSLIVVEFQPGRGPGTYLNVGVMWLWAERNHWAFDEGARVYWRDDETFTYRPEYGERGWNQHVGFIRAGHFARDVAPAARVAAAVVRHLRERFPDLAATAAELAGASAKVGQDPLWHAYHAGAAAALGGDPALSDRFLAEVASTDSSRPWAVDLARGAAELLRCDHAARRDRLVATIGRTRALLAVPPVTAG